MKKCTRCLHANQDDVRFCENCGMKFPEAEAVGENEVGEDAAAEAEPVEEAAAQPSESEPAAEAIAVEQAVEAESAELAEEPTVQLAVGEAEPADAAAEPITAAEVAPGPSAAPASAPAAPGPDPADVAEAAARAAAAASAASAAAQAAPASAAGAVPNPQPAAAARPAGAPSPAEPYSCDGILGRAWKDVRTSPGWFGKSALLALIGLVPILNFVTYGYALRWGRLASFKAAADKPMPSVSVNGDYFKFGFFSLIISLIFGIVISLISMIPILGVVAMIAGIVFTPLVYMSMQRMNLLNSFGAAFDLKKIWQMYRRNIGGSIALAIVPELLGVAAIVVACVGIVLLCGISFVSISSASVVFRGIGLLGMIAVVVACYVLLVIAVVVSLVIFRAFGYWAARVAPEWIDETYLAAGMVPPAR